MDDVIEFNTRKVIVFGFSIITFAVGGFILWASLTKIDAAAIAPGKLVAESQRKKVQHLHGGQVKQILAFEGQHVEKGQTLIELSDVQVEADFQRILLKTVRAQAQIDRLTPLLAGKGLASQSGLVFSSLVLEHQQRDEVTQIMIMQQLMFERQTSDSHMLNQQFHFQKNQLEHSLKGVQLRLKATQKQLSLVQEEVQMNASLLDDGFVSKSRHLAIQRSESGVEGLLAQLRAEVDVTTARLGELNQSHAADSSNRELHWAQQLQEQRQIRDEGLHRLSAQTDKKQHVTITAQHSGTVVAMAIHSIGAVISPGQILMELVPETDEMIVEAYVRPEDIDVVHAGLLTQVRLTAYDSRDAVPMSGEVIHVSADRFFASAAGQPEGYLVKVKLTPGNSKQSNIKLYPGMSADVFIVLQPRTLLEYLLSPLGSSFELAFRES
ncbi:HlyD family type I secretion periplasmic adaptor subunit [Shewanella sp. KX20019]|uniref:HlyD family type I secretion periplasmic adaptor subunit n=1 Tax=Shewanella sp. KX20019 TaxID=2803864 RepID=UPI001925E50F|nr:HlyD family type I secretion periplasmic adaptor subunit [Shewanella sp. KX20019]QQX81638.1 HlyD family type I secretion periplasmic adaptor subunit [Shewanella sp. KX20019]